MKLRRNAGGIGMGLIERCAHSQKLAIVFRDGLINKVGLFALQSVEFLIADFTQLFCLNPTFVMVEMGLNIHPFVSLFINRIGFIIKQLVYHFGGVPGFLSQGDGG